MSEIHSCPRCGAMFTCPPSAHQCLIRYPGTGLQPGEIPLTGPRAY